MKKYQLRVLGLSLIIFLGWVSELRAASVPYGIVDKARGYSADFALVTGPATITISPADLPIIARVVISAKDPYRRGWITLYDGQPAPSIQVNYEGTPLLLELLWSGELVDGKGLISWGDKPATTGSGGGDTLGSVWDETENGWNGVWTRRGTSNIFDALWTKAGVAAVTAVLTITVTGSKFSIQRRQVSEGYILDYEGTLESDGRSVMGTGKILKTGFQFPWQATIRR